MIDIIPTWQGGRFTKTENASTIANVKLHGITKPMIVTRKLQNNHDWRVNHHIIIENESLESYPSDTTQLMGT